MVGFLDRRSRDRAHRSFYWSIQKESFLRVLKLKKRTLRQSQPLLLFNQSKTKIENNFFFSLNFQTDRYFTT